MRLSGWGRDLLDLVLPTGCVSCGQWMGREPGLVCPGCRSRLQEAPWPRCSRCHHPRGTGRADADACFECSWWPDELTRARFAHVLEPPATDLVHALKYEGWKELAVPMAEKMAAVAPPGVSRSAIVVPMPTTGARERRRGYNQASVLAAELARRWGRPVLRALVRHTAGRSQITLAPRERRENVRGTFAAVPGCERALSGRAVALIDDVLTTGATAGEAATVLSSRGAASVTLVAFARALPGRPGPAR